MRPRSAPGEGHKAHRNRQPLSLGEDCPHPARRFGTSSAGNSLQELCLGREGKSEPGGAAISAATGAQQRTGWERVTQESGTELELLLPPEPWHRDLIRCF